MSGKNKSVPMVLVVGTTYPLLSGGADELNKTYIVRVAETQETALGYLGCMKFDLVVIEDTVSPKIVSAIVNAVSQGTAIYFPKSLTAQAIVREVTRRFKSQPHGSGERGTSEWQK